MNDVHVFRACIRTGTRIFPIPEGKTSNFSTIWRVAELSIASSGEGRIVDIIVDSVFSTTRAPFIGQGTGDFIGADQNHFSLPSAMYILSNLISYGASAAAFQPLTVYSGNRIPELDKGPAVTLSFRGLRIQSMRKLVEHEVVKKR
jgi:hypothetical protein